MDPKQLMVEYLLAIIKNDSVAFNEALNKMLAFCKDSVLINEYILACGNKDQAGMQASTAKIAEYCLTNGLLPPDVLKPYIIETIAN